MVAVVVDPALARSNINVQGTKEFLHRARLLPLPLLAPVPRLPCTASARIRHRWKMQRFIVALTNRTICTLNRLYSAPSTRNRTLSVRRPIRTDLHSSQPDIDFSCHCCCSSDRSSSAQQRVIALLRQRCAAFVSDRAHGSYPIMILPATSVRRYWTL